MKQKLSLALLLTAIAVIISLVYTRLPGLPAISSPAETFSPRIEIGNQILQVTVADTPLEREKGLSGRDALFPAEGMLFVFEEDGYHAFWMKDMKFPIDIVWISYSGEIVDIRENISPDSYPAVFTPRRSARYALELPAGFVKEYSFQLGDKVRL